MFKRISYNYFSNKIDLWETINGRTVHQEINPELIYYVYDKDNKSELKDIYGKSVIPKIAKSSKDLKNLKNSAIKCCETDIDIKTKFLNQYYSDKEMKVDMNNINICTFDIEYDTSKGYCKVEEAIHPINLITFHFSKSGRLVTIGLNEYTGNNPLIKEYHWVHSEKMLLEKSIQIFKKEKVDIITGWNVELFDCVYFQKRCEHHGIENNFSPLNRCQIKSKEENKKQIYYVEYDGLAVLDYLPLYKKFTYENRGQYTLQNIGLIEVDEGKKDYEGTLNDLSESDWNGFVEYNVQDVLLVVKFENGNPDAKDVKKRAGLRFIELAVTICYEALIPFDHIFSQMAILTGFILKFLHEEGMVLPDRESKTSESLPGGYVYALKGLFKHIISFDVESMYPHAIMAFNIGPDTLMVDPDENEKLNCYSTPVSEYKTWVLESGETIKCGGIYFRKDKKSILNRITNKIFKERKFFKNKKSEAEKENNSSLAIYYDRQQLIRKILINSLYGVLGNKHFHLYNIYCARAITLSCQNLIKFLSDNTNNYLQNYFYLDKKYFNVVDEKNKLSKPVCIRIDTDSNFLCLDEILKKLNLTLNDEEFVNWCNTFVNDTLNPFYDEILNVYANKYGVPQIINFKREKILTHMLIYAKKEYSYRMIDKEGKFYNPAKIENVGGALVKKTTPQFCRDNLTRLIHLIFEDKDKEFISDEIAKIKKEFIKRNPNDISILKGTSNYSNYAKDIEYYLNSKLEYADRCPIQVRAAMNYNYTLNKHNLKLLPIGNGAKIRYIQIKSKNFIKQDIIAWMGEYPKEFENLFEIDYELQFEKTFLSVIQSIFHVLKWGIIKLKISKINKFFQ